MGFFADNATYGAGGGSYEVAQPGVYACRLKELVKETRPGFDQASRSYSDEANPEPCFRFVFETIDPEDVDKEGNPYRFTKRTSTNYGGDKAALTQILDGMLGGHITQEEFRNLDIEELRRRTYQVTIENFQKRDGSTGDGIKSVAPSRQRRQNAPAQEQAAAPAARQTAYTPPPAPAERVHAGGPKPGEEFADPFADE